MDELSLGGRSLVVELRDGKIRRFQLSPEELGWGQEIEMKCGVGDPRRTRPPCGMYSPVSPVRVATSSFSTPPAALVAGGLAADLPSGIRSAAEAIDSGAVADKLESYVALTQSLAGAAP